MVPACGSGFGPPYQVLLKQQGFDVSTTDTGESGYSTLEQALEQHTPYDGLLLDWVLPDMSGADLLKKVGSERRFDALSVMIFTERPDEKAYQLASERPNNDIQHKEDLTLLPYRMQKFLKTYSGNSAVGNWVARQQQYSQEKLGGEILFVDDSPTVCAKYGEMLRTNGYEVTVAHSMSAALEISKSQYFKLAIVDHYMPNGNGDELCRALLSNPLTSDITVVMHSQSRDVLEQALDAGAIDLLWKDDPANIFLMRVSSIIRNLQVRHQAQELNILLAATQTLGVGMMIKRAGDQFKPFNETIERFSDECGGLEPFLVNNDTLTHHRITDLSGKDRAFNFFAVKGNESEEVLLIQEVTAMANALEQAEAASKAKDDFLASMSHELRTPLTAIIGNSGILAQTPLNDDQNQLLRAVEVSGKGLLSLINDILDRSKIEAGRFEVDQAPYSIRAMIDDVQHIFSTHALDSGLDFSVELKTLPTYQPMGDGRRVSQILINLLGNAVKFTSEGYVRMEVWSDDDTLHFSVTDSGIGMSQDVLDRLFKPFEQADSSISRRFGGTGLGLHISWSLCELMEGTIEVESDVDSGSKFELILPYHPSNLVEMSEGDIDAKKLPYLVKKFSGNVLIAEDSAALQILERRMVETVGCTVTIANNGSEAVELAAYNSFDLILMDMQMPVMDGIEATATLRQLDIQTPIVALTANVMPQHRDQFKKAGCNHFVDKPIDMAALQQVFENYLTPASKEEEATTVAPALANHSEVIDDELIDIFVTYTKTQLDELKQAYATLSWEEIRGIAHTVKGNGTSFGHPELTEQGAKVCDLIYQQAWTQLPDQMELLISFMEQAITHP